MIGHSHPAADVEHGREARVDPPDRIDQDASRRKWSAAPVSLGIGTALVYPTLLAVVGDVAHPKWRGSAVGFYRFWRDIGYAAGALVAGALADAVGMRAAIVAIGALTAASGALVAIRMPERLVPTVDLEAG